jgi:hypothetical protein
MVRFVNEAQMPDDRLTYTVIENAFDEAVREGDRGQRKFSRRMEFEDFKVRPTDPWQQTPSRRCPGGDDPIPPYQL